MFKRRMCSPRTRLSAIVLASSAHAGEPALEIDLTYSDVFPAENTLIANATVNAKSWIDVTAGDTDATNAQLGDSAVVVADTGTVTTRAFLSFRVYPGPATDTGDPFFARYGGGFTMPGGTFATARMDTAEASGIVAPGRYATYLHEDDGGVEGDPLAKIVLDDVLTPGSRVEYFFAMDAGEGTPVTTVPDTSGGHWLEFEALPGFFDAPGGGGADVLAPCTLFVDASDGEGRIAIEEFGLSPYFGISDDSGHDRFDYQAVEDPGSASLAREENGDNGMTQYQSLFYETILYHTGSNEIDGVRDGDAALLSNWLTSDDLGRDLVHKGLWLSGDGMASILSRPDRPVANLFLTEMVGAELVCPTYCEAGCATGPGGDGSACTRLDPVPGTGFGTPTYAGARQDGCPSDGGFDVLNAVGAGSGNLVYVDQDAPGQPTTAFASIVNDQFDSSSNYGVVLDGFSLASLRRVDGSFSGSDCGEDSTAITTRVSDVFTWFGMPTGNNYCDLGLGPLDTPEVHVPRSTRLLVPSPNPFNPSTTIRYDLAENARVTLRVFDAQGRPVRTLVDGPARARRHDVIWDGRADDGEEVSSGVYWARLETSEGYRQATRLVVLK